jgi:hypothetical protein
MTPSDELWIEMASFDIDLADGIWEGTAAPEVAPAWYGEVATLIRTANAPALPDELVAEGDVVASMQAAILAAQAGDLPPIPEGERPPAPVTQLVVAELPADEQGTGDPAGEPATGHTTVADPAVVTLPPSRLSGTGDADDESGAAGGERRGRGRIVRRVVAVKAVAATTAFAIGITAAAATTGIVTVVVPAARDRLLPKDSPSEITEERLDERSPAGEGRSGGSRQESESSGDGREIDAPASERSGTTDAGDREPGEDGDGTSASTGDGGTVDGEQDGTATTTVSDPAAPDEPRISPDPTPTTTETPTTTTTETPPTTGTTIEPLSDPGPNPGPQAAASTTSVVETYVADATVADTTVADG